MPRAHSKAALKEKMYWTPEELGLVLPDSPPPRQTHTPSAAVKKQKHAVKSTTNVVTHFPLTPVKNYEQVPGSSGSTGLGIEHQSGLHSVTEAEPGKQEDASGQRVCSVKTCKRSIPADYGNYKMCNRCREKNREYSRRMAAKAKLRKDASRAAHVKEKDWSQLTTQEKLGRYMTELRALGKLGLAEDAMFAEQNGRDTKKAKDDKNDPEYATAGDLYDDLRDRIFDSEQARDPYSTASRSERRLNFKGCYCVVRNFDEEITRDRVFAEFNNVKAEGRVRVRESKPPTRIKLTVEGRIGYKMMWECACLRDGSSCGGVVTYKLFKIREGVTTGEKYTIRVKH